VGPQTHDHNSVKSEPIRNIFTRRFLGKFVVKRIFKIPPYLARLANTLLKGKESARDNHVLACNFAKYLPV